MNPDEMTMSMTVSEFMDLVGGVVLNGIPEEIRPTALDTVGEMLVECVKLARDCGFIKENQK